MRATSVNPILNVSDLAASFAWFERLGWRKMWDHGEPPTFGAVRSGDVEVFLCEGAQGGGAAWMSVWVDDVDALREHCRVQGITVAQPTSSRRLHNTGSAFTYGNTENPSATSFYDAASVSTQSGSK